MFRTHNKEKRNDFRLSFRDLLLENKFMNNNLQDKINYYYGPYSKKGPAGCPIGMDFDENLVNENAHPNEICNEKAKKRWGSISRALLGKNKDSFRAFIQSINPAIYSKLKEVGIQYYLDEFRKAKNKVTFPDIQRKGETEEEKLIEDKELESQHLKEGLRKLKRIVKQRALTMKETKEEKEDTDFIEPLVYLLRGNREIKKKKDKLFKSIQLEKKEDKPKLDKYAVSDALIKKWKKKNNDSILTKSNSEQCTLSTSKILRESSKASSTKHSKFANLQNRRSEDGDSEFITKLLGELEPKMQKVKSTRYRSNKIIKGFPKVNIPDYKPLLKPCKFSTKPLHPKHRISVERPKIEQLATQAQMEHSESFSSSCSSSVSL